MYVENLCENCERGPNICNTKNCELDRSFKDHPTRITTISSTTEYKPYKSTTYFDPFEYFKTLS